MIKRSAAASGLAIALIAILAGAPAPAAAAPVFASYVNPTWTDADKLHDFGDWSGNWWNDSHDFGQWNSDEQLSDTKITAWSNPVYRTDLSCWIASAANMLAGFGIGGGNAQNMYWDMVYNMQLPWNNGKDGWQWGGWQHEALNWYLTNRPHEGSYEVGYYGVYNKEDGSTPTPWPTNPFDTAANLLASGYEIGLVVHGSIYHAITFEGYDDKLGLLSITDSDDDAGGKDLSPFPFDLSGPTRWSLTNYVPGGIAIDYFATLHRVPEPGSLALLAGGLLALGAARRRPENRTNP